MGLPGQRRSKSSKLRRAAHFALKKRTLTTCPNCKRKIPPHTVCPFCGMYNGRKVMETKTMKRLTKLNKRAKAEGKKQ
jgi:large subunit ribosomal protein L32